VEASDFKLTSFLCPFFRLSSVYSWQQIVSHRKDIHEILYSCILPKAAENVTVSIETCILCKKYFFIYISVVHGMRNFLDTFIEKLMTSNSNSIIYLQKNMMFMRLCAMIYYGQTGHR